MIATCTETLKGAVLFLAVPDYELLTDGKIISAAGAGNLFQVETVERLKSMAFLFIRAATGMYKFNFLHGSLCLLGWEKDVRADG